MKKTNKFIETKPNVLGPNYEFVDSNGGLSPFTMVEGDKEFLIVDEFSEGARAMVVNNIQLNQVSKQDDDEEIVYAEEVFDDEEDIYSSELKDRLVEKTMHRKFNVIGESIDEAYAKNGRSGKNGHNLLSAMMFSRIIYLSRNEDVKPEIEDLFKTLSNPNFVVQYDEGNSIAYNQMFNDAVSFAKNNPNRPVFIYVEKLSSKGLFDFLRPLYPYIDNPSGDSYITALGKSIYIPHNLWILFTINSDNSYFDISRRILRYISILKLETKATKASERATLSLSLEEINASLREAGEERTILEDSWKKIDSLSETINRVNGYVIQNKIVRRMEDYASTLFCLEPSEDELIDLILSRNIISEAIITSQPQMYADQNDLINEINNSFGPDSLPLTREVINSYLSLFDKGGKRINA